MSLQLVVFSCVVYPPVTLCNNLFSRDRDGRTTSITPEIAMKTPANPNVRYHCSE